MTQKKALTRRLASRDLVFIVLGIIIIILLVFLRSLPESEDTTDADKEKIRELMTREGLVINGDKDLGAFG